MAEFEGLSVERLREEIVKEEKILKDLYTRLAELVKSRDETRSEVDRLRKLTEDIEKRADRISAFESRVTELHRRIRDTYRKLETVNRRIALLETRLPVAPTLSNYFRLMREIRTFHTFLRRYPPPRVVTRAYYHHRIEENEGWMRDIRELRSLYGRKGGFTSAINRWESEVPHLTFTIRSLKGWQKRQTKLVEKLPELRVRLHRLIGEITPLKEIISREETRLERKKKLLPPVKLCRIKIRLYNMIRGPKGSPVGMFQGWYDIDTIIDPETGEPDFSWWLTKEEVDMAKYRFVGYWKEGAKWLAPSDVGQAYFDETGGIPHPEETVSYKRYKQPPKTGLPYTKNVPSSFVARAERMSVKELIVGESSVAPKPVDEPKGLYTQQMMIIKDSTIVWQERRDRFVWKPPESYIRKVKEELGL